jgi:C-terminal processing protease CtpA/Prc
MIASIHDSHGFLNKTTGHMQPNGYYLPFDIKFIDKKMVVSGFLNDSLAKLDGLTIGTVITQIDGKPVEQLVEEQRTYIPASNEAAFYRNLKYALSPSKSPQVTLSMEYEGKMGPKTISRCSFSQLQRYTPQTRKVCEWLASDIGYINMGKLEVSK